MISGFVRNHRYGLNPKRNRQAPSPSFSSIASSMLQLYPPMLTILIQEVEQVAGALANMDFIVIYKKN
jgi:hypothetical protein